MCRYCEDYTKKVYSYKNNKSWFSMYENYLEVVINEEKTESFKINYCPMCGERINEWKLIYTEWEENPPTEEEVKYKMEYECLFFTDEFEKED